MHVTLAVYGLGACSGRLSESHAVEAGVVEASADEGNGKACVVRRGGNVSYCTIWIGAGADTLFETAACTRAGDPDFVASLEDSCPPGMTRGCLHPKRDSNYASLVWQYTNTIDGDCRVFGGTVVFPP